MVNIVNKQGDRSDTSAAKQQPPNMSSPTKESPAQKMANSNISCSNSQAFFSHRMSNSNANLKHVIRSYKEDNNIIVQSPVTKQNQNSHLKRQSSRRQSLTNKAKAKDTRSNGKLTDERLKNGNPSQEIPPINVQEYNRQGKKNVPPQKDSQARSSETGAHPQTSIKKQLIVE